MKLKLPRWAGWLGLVLVLIGGAAVAPAMIQALKNDPPDETLAEVSALRPRAEAGDAQAQKDLASVYMSKRHCGLTMMWLRQAAVRGHADALGGLAMMHYFGFGVPKNDLSSFVFMELAVARGRPNTNSELFDQVKAQLTPKQLQQGEAWIKDWKENTPMPWIDPQEGCQADDPEFLKYPEPGNIGR